MPAPGTIPIPSPAAVAESVRRLQDSRRRLVAVDDSPAPQRPSRLVPLATVAHKKRLASEPVPGEPAVIARDRARWVDCSAGRHTWVQLPALLITVCRHCPIQSDQADRIRAAHQARHTTQEHQ